MTPDGQNAIKRAHELLAPQDSYLIYRVFLDLLGT